MKLITKEIAKTIPDLYGQDGKGMKAIVHLHLFCYDSDWWITEYDGYDTAFGYAVLNGDWQNAEFGYMSIDEMEDVNTVSAPLSRIRRDEYWTKVTVETAIRNSKGQMYG